MNNDLKKTRNKQIKRSFRVRKQIKARSNRHRLIVVKTNKHIFSQLVNDVEGKTLVGFSTQSKEAKAKKMNKKSIESARFIGAQMASLAKLKGVESVVLDRGRFKYHGIVKQFADAAREAGLKF